ncbi:unnamed protein product [Sympodiomycopsis kandeliae]
MQISQALLALLAIPAARALPLNTQSAVGVLNARGSPSQANSIHSNLLSRNVSPKARGAAESVQTIYARYAHIRDDGERSVAVVRDLQRRGIIDTLVQALAAILTELLGTDGAPARHYRRQLAALGMQTGSIIDDITCLILKLVGINDSNCQGKPSKRDVSSASNSFTGLNAADPEAMRESLGELLSQVGRALEKEEFPGNDVAYRRGDDAHSDLMARQFPAQLGVEGLLEVLRQLLDAVLNTLLPLSPRSAAASVTQSAATPTGTNCPPPGTPNDGMYRPGCPGYGRRDLSARDSEQLENIAPMLEMLIQKLEPMVQKADAAASQSTGTDDASVASPTAAASSASAASSDDTTTPDGSSSSAVEGALAQLSSSASTPSPSSPAGGDSTSSGSAAARDLLEGDGFRYVKRQAAAAAPDASSSEDPEASATSTSSSSTPSSSSSSDSGNSASYSMVKGIVSELFSLMSGGASSKSSQSSADDSTASTASSGGSSDSFMSMISSVLGGLSSRDVVEGPIHQRDVHNLMDRALGNSPGVHIMKGLVTRYVNRAVDQTNEVLKARADFTPVWSEVKKLGNAQFSKVSNNVAERSDEDGSFNNVWSTFRDMIDASIDADKKQASNGSKRSPSPAVDVKPFADAATKWAQKNLAHDREHTKRDLQQFQPLANAAAGFAKKQMQEWTAALNKHNNKN